MLAKQKAAFDCIIKAFSETDFTGDLARFDVPTLVLHADLMNFGLLAFVQAG